MKAYVPREFIMVYAPRDRMELGVVCRIIEAAGFWVSGKRFDITITDQAHPAGSLPEEEAEPLAVAGAGKL